jgi:hypothetical protein
MANTYLTRTNTVDNGTGGCRFTFSTWFKRSGFNTGDDMHLLSNRSSDTNRGVIRIGTNNSIAILNVVGSTNMILGTNAVFRDVSAWYHLVVQIDTISATVVGKIFINGVEQSLSTNTMPASGTTTAFMQNIPLYLGTYQGSSGFFDGLMSHTHLVDGTIYDPTAFGEYDANGVWTINTSPSVTYGTNGFFILKNGNSVTDQSSNSNNFTVAGGTLTNTEDSPSNVFATLNPLDNFYSGHGLTNGNTRTSSSTSTNYQSPIFTTLGAASGKYYAECKVIQTSTAYSKIGIGATQITGTNQGFGSLSNQYVYNGETGGITGQSNGATYTDGDIVGIALDLDNNKLYFHKNGTYQNSGVPTSGSTGTGASSITAASSTGLGFYLLGCGDIAGNSPQAIWEWNFGNGYFGTTAVSSAGTNASGIGIFEYDVPTGYTALSTKGLNL